LKNAPIVERSIVNIVKRVIKKKYVWPGVMKFKLLWPRAWWPEYRGERGMPESWGKTREEWAEEEKEKKELQEIELEKEKKAEAAKKKLLERKWQENRSKSNFDDDDDDSEEDVEDDENGVGVIDSDSEDDDEDDDSEDDGFNDEKIIFDEIMAPPMADDSRESPGINFTPRPPASPSPFNNK